MQPFIIPESLNSLTEHYPHPKTLLEAAHSGGEPARIAVAQLWLSEGIPHGFHCCPAIYDAVRCWLSDQLGVHPKEISLVGSARLGKSLSPKNLGKPFDNKSDLDLFIVSSTLFEKLKADFYHWLSDLENGCIRPRNCKEEYYWSDNKERIPKLIARGFIFANRIPNFPRYCTAIHVNNTMSRLVDRLKDTPKAPNPKKASVRCYSSWCSFVQQTLRNLEV